jgi:hypothetical protein
MHVQLEILVAKQVQLKENLSCKPYATKKS